MGNAATDYERQNALEGARKQDSQLPSPAQFHAPRAADNYNAPQSADNYSDKENLENERNKDNMSESKKAVNLAGDVAKAATPMGALSLLKQINFLGDMPYAAAIGAGMVKDLFDAGTFETIIIPIIVGIIYSIFTFMMTLLGVSGQKKAANVFLKKGLMILAGMLVGFIPGLNIIPEATATALTIYIMTLSERKHAAKE